MLSFSRSRHVVQIKNGTSTFHLATVVLCGGSFIVAVRNNSLEVYIYFLYKKIKNPTKWAIRIGSGAYYGDSAKPLYRHFKYFNRKTYTKLGLAKCYFTVQGIVTGTATKSPVLFPCTSLKKYIKFSRKLQENQVIKIFYICLDIHLVDCKGI